MVITPDKATQLTAHERRILTALTGSIDAVLSQRAIAGHDCSIAVPLPLRECTRVYDSVLRLYQKTGWSVRYVNDSSGDYLRFRPR